MERRRDQRIAAESENDAGGVSRAQAAETGPCGVESQVGERQEPCHPVADEHREHGPDHGDDDPGLARVVIIARQSRFGRSEEHTSELQSLMRISYAVFCLKKKTSKRTKHSAT